MLVQTEISAPPFTQPAEAHSCSHSRHLETTQRTGTPTTESAVPPRINTTVSVPTWVAGGAIAAELLVLDGKGCHCAGIGTCQGGMGAAPG